jgi:hypothetical protein
LGQLIQNGLLSTIQIIIYDVFYGQIATLKHQILPTRSHPDDSFNELHTKITFLRWIDQTGNHLFEPASDNYKV